MNIPYCMTVLRPGQSWQAGEDPSSIEMLDGTQPPTLDELNKVQADLEVKQVACKKIYDCLAAKVGAWTRGQIISYQPAVDAITSDLLTLYDEAAAKDIVVTYPGLDPATRADLLSCFPA